MAKGQLYIGTSGWSYPAWKESFYQGTPQKRWLEFYAQRFSSVEVNATFYRMQSRKTFANWRERTPDHFRFAIKGNRYLTHTRRMKDPQRHIDNEIERAEPLGDKLVAVLWQLPQDLEKDLPRLATFCEALKAWDRPRHVIEFRHSSWFDDEVAGCLETHRIATCQSDAADWPLWDRVTAGLAYIRLHGHERTYVSSYGDGELREWIDKIERWRARGRDVYVYFDNDAEGAAPVNARRLKRLLGD